MTMIISVEKIEILEEYGYRRVCVFYFQVHHFDKYVHETTN